MEQSLASQPVIFGYACLFGAVLGVYYDVFRIIRLLTASERRHIFFQDVFYLFTCGVFTFLFTFATNNGELRFYILAGEAIGWCVYYLTIGAITLRLSTLVVTILEKIIAWLKKYIFLPVFHFLKVILRFLCLPLVKLARFIKKSAVKSKIGLKRQGDVVYNSVKHSVSKKKAGKKKKGKKKNEGYQKKKI